MLAAQVTDNSYKGWQASLALQFCYTPEKTLLHSAHHVGPLTATPATCIYCTRQAG